MSETSKAFSRRLAEDWFTRYAPADQPGIDIGCQHDPLNDAFRKWDLIFGDSDATFMAGVADDSYQTVYASHVLEHLSDPIEAIRNWHRICRPGGHVIISVPHRDLYEKRDRLPSRWNADHKFFYLSFSGEPPDTLGLFDVIKAAIGVQRLHNNLTMNIAAGGWIDVGPDVHSVGEYSIEAIIRKGV